MVWVDYVILVIVFGSLVLGVIRGFIREVVSLLSWALAVGCGLAFTPQLAAVLEPLIEIPSLRTAVAFALIFLGVFLVGLVTTFYVRRLLKKQGFSFSDRLLGLIFGLARGFIIVSVLVLLGELTPFPQDPWWQQSQLIDYFGQVSHWLQTHVPPDLLQRAKVLL